MSEKFKSFTGKFTCQKCNELADVCRFWFETKDVTWMCTKKHISKVNLIPKTKRDYENE